MKILNSALLGITLCFLSLTAPTLAVAMPIISLQPALANVAVGDSVFVDLVWDGDGANYIGAFDINIVYIDDILSYEGAIIDPVFGVDSLGCFFCGDESVPGVVDLFEISFDDVVTLMANQDGLGNAFVLATMEFRGLQDGVTDLLLSGTFGNEFGLPFAHDLVNGSIVVGDGGATPVSEPGTLSLLAIGLAGIAWMRRRKIA